MTPPTTEALQTLHQTYLRESKRTEPHYTMTCGYVWEKFLFEGYTLEDLVQVIRYLRRNLKPYGKFTEATFQFRSLIEDTGKFADVLGTARAIARIPTPNHAKDAALRATGRTGSQVQNEAKSAATILNESKALAELRKMKEEL